MMFRRLKKLFYIIFFVSIFFNLNVYAKTSDTIRLLDLFGSVFEKTHKEYVDEISEQELIEKAINGMLSGLDPHSGYMNEETYNEMQIDTSGKFGGLGIQITMEDGLVKIISPIDDTPAFKAGLKAGDYITQINDTPIVGLTLTEAVDLMRGKPGSKITITIARDQEDLFDVTIVRDIIKIQSVKHKIFYDIGYIRISSFNEQANTGLKKSIIEIQKKLENKELGYILDVRNNPGGLLNQAVTISDSFLQKGEIVSTRERKGKKTRTYKAKPGDITNNKPIVVLINGGSASASEILAGALQDHRRAIIIGTKSFGKGSVQSIIPLRDYRGNNQGAMRLTTARYYTPNGLSIQGKGIEPDILVNQGNFKSTEIESYSESDLVGSLDKDKTKKLKENQDEELINIIENDYQLSRAIDFIKAISLFNKS